MSALACTVPGCGRKPTRGDMCAAHEWRKRHNQPLDTPIARRQPRGLDTRCAVSGCTRLGAVWLGDERICTSHEARRKRGMVDWKERPMPPVRGRSRHQRAGELVALNVRLPVAEARRLDRLAEARGITRGTAARQAILAWLDAARPDGRVAAGDLHASASWARRADAWEEA